MQRGLLLNIVVAKSLIVNQLLPCKDKSLLILFEFPASDLVLRLHFVVVSEVLTSIRVVLPV